jgi:Lactate racemase N-terminal domain
MRRVPLLSGSRVVHVPLADDDVILAPPPPPSHVVDVAAAVRDALRFPLDGRPLAALAPRDGRVTVVVEPPSLPLPGAQFDPRPQALATVLGELSAHGIRGDRQTILVAGGLSRKLPQRDLERLLLPPPRARDYHGRVLVHDAADPELADLHLADRKIAAISSALLDTDLVVVVSSAETVLHGGPAALLSACDAATIRGAAAADSLLQAAGEPVWQLALAVERAVAARLPLVGVSLVLDHPRLLGRFRDYPHDPRSFEHVSRSPLRRLYSVLPASLRREILRDMQRTVAATGAFAGTPSVAHAESLLRTVELRGVPLDEPLDALVVGTPWIGPHLPRELLNPITSAATSLGLVLRLWRDAFPVKDGGTLILVHSLLRTFAHGTQAPYRVLFDALARGADLETTEQESAVDPRALEAYRAGRTCHPCLPFADWAGCQPPLARLGAVVVAGSRDAVAARALGFVPSHSIASALDMAHGLAGGRARVGVLPAPPFAPLLVGPS